MTAIALAGGAGSRRAIAAALLGPSSAQALEIRNFSAVPEPHPGRRPSRPHGQILGRDPGRTAARRPLPVQRPEGDQRQPADRVHRQPARDPAVQRGRLRPDRLPADSQVGTIDAVDLQHRRPQPRTSERTALQHRAEAQPAGPARGQLPRRLLQHPASTSTSAPGPTATTASTPTPTASSASSSSRGSPPRSGASRPTPATTPLRIANAVDEYVPVRPLEQPAHPVPRRTPAPASEPTLTQQRHVVGYDNSVSSADLPVAGDHRLRPAQLQPEPQREADDDRGRLRLRPRHRPHGPAAAEPDAPVAVGDQGQRRSPCRRASRSTPTPPTARPPARTPKRNFGDRRSRRLPGVLEDRHRRRSTARRCRGRSRAASTSANRSPATATGSSSPPTASRPTSSSPASVKPDPQTGQLVDDLRRTCRRAR